MAVTWVNMNSETLVINNPLGDIMIENFRLLLTTGAMILMITNPLNVDACSIPQPSRPIDFLKTKHAAEQGITKSQYELGWLYEFGVDGVQKDISKAIDWYKKAAEQGDSEARNALSRMALNGECENTGIPEHIPGSKGTIMSDNRCK